MRQGTFILTEAHRAFHARLLEGRPKGELRDDVFDDNEDVKTSIFGLGNSQLSEYVKQVSSKLEFYKQGEIPGFSGGGLIKVESADLKDHWRWFGVHHIAGEVFGFQVQVYYLREDEAWQVSVLTSPFHNTSFLNAVWGWIKGLSEEADALAKRIAEQRQRAIAEPNVKVKPTKTRTKV